jgi:hypothetical protein
VNEKEEEIRRMGGRGVPNLKEEKWDSILQLPARRKLGRTHGATSIL